MEYDEICANTGELVTIVCEKKHHFDLIQLGRKSESEHDCLVSVIFLFHAMGVNVFQIWIRNESSEGPLRNFFSMRLTGSCRKKLIQSRPQLSIILKLHISTETNTQITWFIDDKELLNGNRYRIYYEGSLHKLEIFDCELEDHGEIRCKGVNTKYGTMTVSMELKISEDDIAGEEPFFTQQLTYEELEECVTLYCTADGYPIPYVTFHRLGRPLPTNRRFLVQRNENTWIFQINNCTVDDEGIYQAIAKNRMGMCTSRCMILIQNKDPTTYIADK
ncbi:unnamed protein product [Dracunculus medinensis]|uniref:Ig-like domain-containing protein n=1 Tax=Dracunculus medinensis TaxID=318479 RepID=A0A0N4ULZ2_DRAME|nr:unnamed protein product [Dracunculus medinensis]